MKTPTTLKELLDNMESFLLEARSVETGDMLYEDKLDEIAALGYKYGLS